MWDRDGMRGITRPSAIIHYRVTGLAWESGLLQGRL
jgi:hypothetical protein